ncbi:proline/glycine betaine ABC transporter permease, partial [Rhizobiaceae sp. 2RAB30]
MDFDFSIGKGADIVVDYILGNFMPALDAIATVIGFVTGGIQNMLVALPPVAGIAVLTLLALWRVSWKFALFTL